jgi:TonB family protein
LPNAGISPQRDPTDAVLVPIAGFVKRIVGNKSQAGGVSTFTGHDRGKAAAYSNGSACEDDPVAEVTMRHLVAPLLLSVALASPAVSQVVPERVQVSSSVIQGLLLQKVAPVYPPLARQARIQGSVILKVVINKSGDVESAQLISGHPLLAAAAIEAVKRWEYKPYLLNGEPVEVETSVTVNFTLADTPRAKGVAGDAPGGVPAGEQGAIFANSPADADGDGVVRASQGVMSGLLVTKVRPEYPPDAKGQRIQGTVVMRVKIDKAGDVSNIQLVSGHPLLAPAAIDAVKQWKYKPYLLKGTPVEIDTQVTVDFTLVP